MRISLSIIMIMAIVSASSQNMSYDQFQREAKFNKRILPKHGATTKSVDELEAEKAFIAKAVEEHSSASNASKEMVKKGFKELKKDPKAAMYSFNKAYLLDSSNAEVYLGYGKVYRQFKQYELSRNYYQQGLNIDKNNYKLLNAMAENYQASYEEEELKAYLEESIDLLEKSYKKKPEEAETSRLLTKAYLKMDNCEMANKYFQEYLSAAKKEKDASLTKAMKMQCQASN